MEKVDNKTKSYINAFEDLNKDAQIETLVDVSQLIYKDNSSKFMQDGSEVVNVSYSKTRGGEVVFDVEVRTGEDIHHEYYSKSLDKIMEHNNVLNANIVAQDRKDLENPEEQDKFISDVEESKNRVDAVEEQNKKIDKVAAILGINSKDIEISEIKDENIEGASKNLDDSLQKNQLKLDEQQLSNIEKNAITLNEGDELTTHSTAGKTIGGDYVKYLFIKTGSSYQLLGQKNDGTIEKVEGIQMQSPYMANIAGPDGKFHQTTIDAGFIIKGQNNDVGIGITTNPDGNPKITYQRACNTDNPIGYEVSPSMNFSKNEDKAKNLFDERNTSKVDAEKTADKVAEEQSRNSKKDDDKDNNAKQPTLDSADPNTPKEVDDNEEEPDGPKTPEPENPMVRMLRPKHPIA